MGKAQYPGVSSHGEFIRISFTWKGQRYRPTLRWRQTPANFEKACKLCFEVKSLIKTGVFSEELLVKYFPEYADTLPAPEIPTFGEVAQRFLDMAEITPNTRNQYLKTLNKHWMTEFAPVPIDQIKPSALKEIAAGSRWQTAKTRNNAVSVVRRVFELAVDDGIIESNPADKIKTLKHQEPPPDPFTEQEAERIIQHLYQAHTGPEVVYAAYFEFQFWTGMRPSEAMALRWSDIDWAAETARVDKAQSAGRLNRQTKTAKVRDVMLNARALHALQVMKQWTMLADAQIFVSPRTGESWKTDKAPRVKFVAALKRLGIRRRDTYNTRHTYATVMLMRGVNPAFAANQLGHSIQVFLTRYTKWIRGDQDRAEFAKLKIGPGLAQDRSGES